LGIAVPVGGMTLRMFSDPKLLSNYRQFLQDLINVVAKISPLMLPDSDIHNGINY